MGTDTVVIGVLASVGTGICMLPQLIKTIRTRKAENLSQVMLAILIISLTLWIVYGSMKKDLIIIASNGLALLINTTLMVLSFLFKGNPRQVRHYL